MGLRTLSCLSVLTCIFAAQADDAIDALLEDPGAARAFDYCAWRFDEGGVADGLPEFATLLERRENVERLRAAILTQAGTTVALAEPDVRSCRKSFAAGTKRHERALAKALKRMPSAPRRSDDPEIAEVQSRIHDHWARDQAGRNVYVNSKTDEKSGALFWAARLAVDEGKAVDAASTALLRELVERYDWIDATRFGAATANHAWLLVQHADAHPEFQQDVLTRMEPYLADGGVSNKNYAYLWDRVAVNHDREQRYGTQPDWNCKDGKLELRPVADPDNLDARRTEMGLGPVEQALAQMAANVCRR